ncbi:MAG: hypothetical protein D6698_14900 [Gammaproteobacteria bacterium]|nr:MAG: hypothetical protein D6698_14900 [Gammaproteobacteria bacterium]
MELSDQVETLISVSPQPHMRYQIWGKLSTLQDLSLLLDTHKLNSQEHTPHAVECAPQQYCEIGKGTNRMVAS